MKETKECIVHNRKYLSKFHSIINQIRQTNEFNHSILQKLPKRCCSCHNQENEEIIFDFNYLHKLCQDIKSSEKCLSIKTKPVEVINYIVLDFSSSLTPIQRIYKAGKFIGKRGIYLKEIEKKFEINLQIINMKSKIYLRNILKKLKEENKMISSDSLWILIQMKNNSNDIELIKEYLKNQWNQIDVTTKSIRTKIISSSKSLNSSLSTNISIDTRWKPKQKSFKYLQKLKQKQLNQQENQIEPQPFIKPISMPKQINTSEKTKRK